jgi:cytochrome c-type protein NapB
MKLKIALVTALSAAGVAWAGQEIIIDDQLGLSPVSVFDTPTPAVFEHRNLPPKESGILPRFWDGAPPQTPHHMEKYLPINAKANKCLECHEEPEKIGKKVRGKPTPMSETHYNKVDDELVVSSKRYVCTLCHAPQAEVNTLVGNTFKLD